MKGKRFFTILGIAVALVALGFSVAGAEIDVGQTSDEGASVEVKEGSGGDGGRPVQHESPYSACARENLALSGLLAGLQSSALFGGLVPAPTTTDPIAWMRCTRKDNGTLDQFVTGLNVPAPPAVDVLVAAARSELTIAVPAVATAPPEGGLQLVGVDVWFWVTNNAPVAATAQIPGLGATVTAEPTATHLRFADGATLDCRGPGTPYDRNRSYESQSSDCTHIFDDTGPQPVDVTVDWALTWTATNGQTGILPGLPRTTTLTLPLQQAQAVTD